MSAAVVNAMVKSFEGSSGPLPERLLGALDAAQAAGGDARGMQSGAVVVVRPLAGSAGFSDRVVDIRVDDHRAPLVELRRLLNMVRSGQLLTEANRMMTDGNAQPAIAAAEKATVLSPENDNAWVGLASIQLRAGRKPAAIDALRRAIELNPANKRQLSRNKNFEALLADPEFKKLIGQ
jgi:Flp pilus assembly protein TadD